MSKEETLNNPKESIVIYGAKTHNLRNLDLKLPRNQLVVITGLSGSGKSSLAFDTIYAEGQRRYIETFSAYARQFLGGFERPDVDKIEGLSPVIAIDQKTVNKNPRSTVGTITEIYDFLRLLFARASDAYSYNTNEKMVRYSESKIKGLILKDFDQKKILILAPVIKARKGHYQNLFLQIAKQGFLRVRVDGVIRELEKDMRLDRYKTHDIEIVIDNLTVLKKNEKRLEESIKTAMYASDHILMILELEEQKEPRYFSSQFMCATTGISYPTPDPNTFSFNSPKGACTTCSGLGRVYDINLEKVIPNAKKSIQKGGIIPLGEEKNSWIFNQVKLITKFHKCDISDPIESIPEEALQQILYGTKQDFRLKSEIAGVTRSYKIEFEGIANFIKSRFEAGDTQTLRRWAREFMDENFCSDCKGSRLKKESLYFKIAGENLATLTQMDIAELAAWFVNIEEKLSENQLKIATEVLKEIRARLQFLLDVGLDYLTLNRSSKSLSGGEAQRIRLATQIGTQLVGVLYIFDEPSIGLHQRDNQKLINALINLKKIGNSVIVVEHDQDMIENADYIIDIGPGAGKHGGEIVNAGNYKQFLKNKSITSDYLKGIKKIETPTTRRKGNGEKIKLIGASGHNLKNVDVAFPLGKLVCITGVSGSGKSSLINGTLYPILNQYIYRGVKTPLPYKKIEGIESIDKVIAIDQSPIGRTPRSNPVTYTGVFSEIRSLFTKTIEASIRGYKPGRFSFNVKGGRCETCQGGGVRVIEMNFLPDVQVACDTCQGKRFNRETLEIRYKGKSIADVLEMTINEAMNFFEQVPKIFRVLKTLHEVGLGYLHLGQSSTTLSGGEAQRIKLASELSKIATGRTFYILDEPSTGLHFEDIRVLMQVLNILVDKGNTVLIIEHNLDIIKLADYVIDLGLEGGNKGGYILGQGTPEQLCKLTESYTAKFLREILINKKAKASKN